ncbi:hypothetical protein [Leptospira noguchii]|uniref:hypothetical protein n=1 Tax=Leptospira noguchii TaxID=28182 RepID=UPI000ADB69C5|nr:hypothetical protein [Leptospira noguchii]
MNANLPFRLQRISKPNLTLQKDQAARFCPPSFLTEETGGAGSYNFVLIFDSFVLSFLLVSFSPVLYSFWIFSGDFVFYSIHLDSVLFALCTIMTLFLGQLLNKKPSQKNYF